MSTNENNGGLFASKNITAAGGIVIALVMTWGVLSMISSKIDKLEENTTFQNRTITDKLEKFTASIELNTQGQEKMINALNSLKDAIIIGNRQSAKQ